MQTLEWQEDIWYLDDVVGGKRPRLQAEGDVYGTEENPVSVEAPEMIQEAIAVRSQEEAALSRSLEGITGYREDRKLLYENLQLFMPFYQREQIVLDGNHVDVSHILNQKRVLAVYPMDEQGRRIVALSDKTVNQVKKLRIQFADETTPLIYNMSYIDTRANIASYKVSQIPVHFNFKNYVVNTTSAQFQKLLKQQRHMNLTGILRQEWHKRTVVLFWMYIGEIIMKLSKRRWSRFSFRCRPQMHSIR